MRCEQLKNCDNCELASQCPRHRQFLVCPRVGMAEDCEACMAVEHSQYPKCKTSVYPTRAQGGARFTSHAPVDSKFKEAETVYTVQALYCEFGSRYPKEFSTWTVDAMEGRGAVDEVEAKRLATLITQEVNSFDGNMRRARGQGNEIKACELEAKKRVCAAACNIIHALLNWSKGLDYSSWAKKARWNAEQAQRLLQTT